MNILQEIAEKRKLAVEKRKRQVPFPVVKEEAEAIAKAEIEQNGTFPYPFYQNLKREGMNFICEVKKASPSKGIISQEFPYLEKAMEYEEAGASAISVLTEPEYFLGKDEYLKEISRKVKIPTLRKDFVIDAYQIYEAKLLGASAVLLICMLLEDDRLKEYIEICHTLGLSALVETHDEEEVKRAIRAGATIIGVNNRNLKDFTVDLQTSVRLRKLVPEEIVFISESGIKQAEDIALLREHHVNGVLIGETLMRSGNVKDALRELAGEELGEN
ncbi:MAG: indole-3-glycerol phosphate synthase TrpC [Lachnospiraceae bacterium]|nr:indole-3-glycerol phosphate synthase TrpC [Lachnospiraceae bacterium]